MDYSGSGVLALAFALVLGLSIGLLAGGTRLAVQHMTTRRGV